MTQAIHIGDRVKVFLDSEYWESEGWFTGTVIRIDPYSAHRSFYWVELESDAHPALGKPTRLISVLNPGRIQKL